MISTYNDFLKNLREGQSKDHGTRLRAQGELFRLRDKDPDAFAKWQNKLRSEVRKG